jgi:hypothetical protein
MADVNIYVAAIAGAAGVTGAALPQGFTLIRDGRWAKRDRRERQEAERQQSCLDLLRAAVELRTLVANSFGYRTPDMRERLAQMRKFAADAQLYAAKISMLAPDRFAAPADDLAEAASRLAEAAVKKTKLDQEQMVALPSFDELNKCLETFRGLAVSGTQR